MSVKIATPEIATPLCDDDTTAAGASTMDFAVTVEVEVASEVTTDVGVVDSLVIEATLATESAAAGKTWIRNNIRAMCSESKVVASFALIFVVVLAVIVTEYTPWYTGKTQESPQDSAFLTLQQHMEDGYDDDDGEAFDTAFESFDANNDDVLNETEFLGFFARELSYSAEFERMDVDGDEVLSYPESVAYVQRMGEIEALKAYLIDSLSTLIATEFGFEMKVDAADDEESLALFLEYVAVVAYFGTYDTDLKGYVRHDEFTAISARNEFVAYADSADGISRNAFFDMLYGDGEFSWQGALREIYGEQNEETVSAWAAVEISTDTVRELKVKLNPVQILRDAEAEQKQQAEGEAVAAFGVDGQFQFIFATGRSLGRRRLIDSNGLRSVGFPIFSAQRNLVR